MDTSATNALKSYLQQLRLPVGFSGEIVFKFPVKKGRVKRIMLDEKASTLKEATVIDLIRAIASCLASPSICYRYNSPYLTHPLLTLKKCRDILAECLDKCTACKGRRIIFKTPRRGEQIIMTDFLDECLLCL